MFNFGSLIGGFVMVGLVSRVLERTLFRKAVARVRILAPNVSALMLATVIGGLGMVNTRSSQFVQAFVGYLIPTVLWIIIDTVRETKARSEKPAS